MVQNRSPYIYDRESQSSYRFIYLRSFSGICMGFNVMCQFSLLIVEYSLQITPQVVGPNLYKIQ